jgi:glycerol-3-phosphate acyltransferase PlsY
MTTSRPVTEDFKTTRRKGRRRVLLPLAMVALVVFIGVPAFMLAFFNGGQVGTVAAFMGALFLLLPATILCFIPYAMLMFAVVGMVRVNRRVPRAMRSVRGMVVRTNYVAERASRGIAAPIIAVSKRLAWLERALGIEPPRAK